MKRYDVVLGRSGGRPHARCDETPEGAYVRHYVAQRLIDAKQAEIDALKAERDVAIKHIAEWCVAIQQNGAGWDDWDEYYKNACCRENALPEIRSALNEAIAKARGDL